MGLPRNRILDTRVLLGHMGDSNRITIAVAHRLATIRKADEIVAMVDGVIVERGSVIGMGVYIGQSTRIYDRSTGEISYGRIPSCSVVVPGNLPSEDGKYSLYCAIIVKRVDEKTRAKTSLNDLLRPS